ncbi:MAG: DUF2911 domain-containing protein [Saprospiraceae bacterium]
MKRFILMSLMLVSTISFVTAQIRTPQPSPTASISQSVGLSTISVDYSRPSMKGRKIYGDLVPFGQYWRTGANQGTKVTFSDDVKINGKDLKKGKYSLFTIPGASEWQVIFHNNAGLGVPGGDDYKMSDEALRIAVKPVQMPYTKESFTIEFDKLKDSGAEMFLSWESTRVAFDIDVLTDGKVLASINEVMAGPSSGDYMAAANYYASSGKDINKAAEWAAKGVSMGANQFFYLRQYSLILAKAGKYSEAISAAKESLMKSQEAKNNDYIKMNTESIAEWSKMKK